MALYHCAKNGTPTYLTYSMGTRKTATREYGSGLGKTLIARHESAEPLRLKKKQSFERQPGWVSHQVDLESELEQTDHA